MHAIHKYLSLADHISKTNKCICFTKSTGFAVDNNANNV